MVDFLEEVFVVHMWALVFTLVVVADIGLLYFGYRIVKSILEALT